MSKNDHSLDQNRSISFLEAIFGLCIIALFVYAYFNQHHLRYIMLSLPIIALLYTQYLKKKSAASALKELPKSLFTSSSSEEWYNRGLTVAQFGNYEEAITYYDKALKADPDYVDALIAKGSALEALKKYSDSIKCYDKALHINPESSLAWFYKGWTNQVLEAYDESIRCYNKALQIDPNDAGTWYYKGTLLQFHEKHQEAYDCYAKAVQIDPSYGEAWYGMGVMAADLSKYTEAREAYKKAIELGFEDAEELIEELDNKGV